MSDICIPYSLARKDMLSFKEIDGALFMQLQSAIHALACIDNERAPNFESLYNESHYNYGNIYTKARKYAKCYEQAEKAYEEFKREHIKILTKGEMIQDSDGPIKLSWIFCDIDKKREKAFARHYKRYEDIYHRLSELSREVQKYAPYSPENKEDTIYEEKERKERCCRSWAENQLEKWYKEHRKKRSVLESNLYSLRSSIPEARYFPYLIRNLRIETNGNICTISGLKYTAGNSSGFTAFNQTLINQTITISR